MAELTVTQVKTKAKKEFMATLKEILSAQYDVYEVPATKSGTSYEYAIQIGTAPTGEPIYATITATVKEYKDRKTEKRFYPAFDIEAEGGKLVKAREEAEEKKQQKKEAKEKKVEKDKARREKEKIDKAKTE